MSALREALLATQGGLANEMGSGLMPGNAVSGEPLGAMSQYATNPSGLRQALAQAAAERGMGRTASREVADAEDAMRFHGAGESLQGGAPTADEVAEQIIEMSRGQPEAVESLVAQLREQDPRMAQEVMTILMGQSPY